MHNYWKFASLRYFNPIGAHETGLLGEYPKGVPNNIFPLITNTAFDTNQELSIYGNDWPRGWNCNKRLYTCNGSCEAHLKILEYLLSNESTYFNINVGTGKGTSVLNLIKILKKQITLKLNINLQEGEKEINHL